MNILSIECTAAPASVCIYDGEKILASGYINVKLTHSQTLLPMIESILRSSCLTLDDIDGISVATGPGSFTGVRIGISVVKGLAVKNDVPCVGVSTLEAMANQFSDCDAIICPVMDARCDQYYNSLFRISSGKVTRLCDDRAILSDDLIADISKLNEQIILCGDGADKFYPAVSHIQNICLADKARRFQSAVGVAFLSFNDFQCGNTVKRQELLPTYLRLPQAERELRKKQEKDVGL
ncbi:MAG: tRNA (adenosine(37)-N6)-threonylcarbamoyltransferase complex dimerization subunit type 1 TsaB [Clostridia bacterium]|nr:tRNA (adenosine(37)-N6)-threonylcarbamoyltransferase complex dimerization subunit type 1 TsaB [Clostridia bacterium]